MMRKLYVIEGGPEPVTPASKVRKRLREAKQKNMPQCFRCGCREYLESRIGTTKQKLCVVCLTNGKRVVMT